MRNPARPTRPAALLLAGLLVAAACGTDAGEVTVDGTTSTSAVPAAPAPSDPAAPDGGAAPGGSPADPGQPVAPGGGSSDTTAPAPGGAEPGAEPEALAPPGGVGSLAGRYLRPDGSEQVLVQVLAQDGAGPRPAVVERVRAVLADVSGKPVTLAFAGLEGGSRQWTSDELRALADRSSPAQTRQQAVLTLLFVHGGFAENDRAVGVAVRGDVAAVFAERVTEAAGTLGDRSAVEDAVTMHEVGHLLGLVDLVLDTGRQDPEHPGHSPNRESVMYYAVESTLLGSILTGGPPRDFDQADLDDLARIRNG